ncbi:ABC transporter ATP-binding protein [Niastella populi]|uniref:ABC transporter ATP-binding protein n=1 Tax=Niastella populi TaxID=550983 RepID=A0A1V9EL33_9BACT|nr:ATP-binding cassette domain-containing protein [Niastella populi]OQP46654.1 ABC transporter ATP-binding protein [Niastella populi]
MKISLINAGKRFNRDWIFRNFQQEFSAGIAYAITGPNGSGKSTLLQVIGGAMIMSEGSAKYTIGNCETANPDESGQAEKRESSIPDAHNQQSAFARASADKEIHVDQAFRYISIAAPYLELIEEMTLQEFLQFHSQFKPFMPGFGIPQIIDEIGLKTATHKQIRFYSSGMKQRVKLAQAIFSNVPCVLLDEPCTNLDAAGIELYHHLVKSYCNKRLVIVSSNDEQEYKFCTEVISILDYKKKQP